MIDEVQLTLWDDLPEVIRSTISEREAIKLANTGRFLNYVRLSPRSRALWPINRLPEYINDRLSTKAAS